MDHGSPFLWRRYIGWTINLNLQVCPCIRETSECSLEDYSALYACMRMYIYIFENGSLFSGGSMLESKWFSWKKGLMSGQKGLKFQQNNEDLHPTSVFDLVSSKKVPFFKRTLTTQYIPLVKPCFTFHIKKNKNITSRRQKPTQLLLMDEILHRLVCIKPLLIMGCQLPTYWWSPDFWTINSYQQPSFNTPPQCCESIGFHRPRTSTEDSCPTSPESDSTFPVTIGACVHVCIYCKTVGKSNLRILKICLLSMKSLWFCMVKHHISYYHTRLINK